ncbi:MAG TPA: class I SAM-dependent methyltransferase [Anaerolineales bacterium]|nr:class I SAM-dependent methyltransferase [Anaerolineales bacterium]
MTASHAAVPTDRSRFVRYLAAKKSIDDRSLNRHVRDCLATALAHDRPQPRPESLQVLEVGAGIGTMIERVLRWGLFPGASYRAVDAEASNIEEARSRLPRWARDEGLSTKVHSDGSMVFGEGGEALRVRFVVGDALELAESGEAQGWDLLIAHAFLDLIDLPSGLPRLLMLLRPGGLFYATLNFDGATILQPSMDPDLDQAVERLYHQTMDARRVHGKASGDSRTGRHLFQRLAAAGVEILASGASDWVVFPQSGAYPGDEAYFLQFIVQTIESALAGHPDLDQERLPAWIRERKAQIERGELVYIAHQLDVLARIPAEHVAVRAA